MPIKKKPAWLKELNKKLRNISLPEAKEMIKYLTFGDLLSKKVIEELQDELDKVQQAYEEELNRKNYSSGWSDGYAHAKRY